MRGYIRSDCTITCTICEVEMRAGTESAVTALWNKRVKVD